MSRRYDDAPDALTFGMCLVMIPLSLLAGWSHIEAGNTALAVFWAVLLALFLNGAWIHRPARFPLRVWACIDRSWPWRSVSAVSWCAGSFSWQLGRFVVGLHYPPGLASDGLIGFLRWGVPVLTLVVPSGLVWLAWWLS